MSRLSEVLGSVLEQGVAGVRMEADRRPVYWGEDGPRYSHLPVLTTSQIDAIIESITDAAQRTALTTHGACDLEYKHGRMSFECTILTQHEYSVTMRLVDDGSLERSTVEHLSLVDEPAPPLEPPADSGPPAEPKVDHTQPSPAPASGMEVFLAWMVDAGATDLHISPDTPPTVRVDNRFSWSPLPAQSAEQIRVVVHRMLTPDERETFAKEQSVDLGYAVDGIGRFRINCFVQAKGPSISVRHLPEHVRTIEDLGLPGHLGDLTKLRSGLLLFCGPTGSGKSTTQAALLQLMNDTQARHIIALEAPIEYVHHSRSCLIQQREVGIHAPTFARGLWDALREDPDVIMVGEMRDRETISLAVAAAETGHLVMGTLHVNTTTNAITRLIDSFPEQERSAARAQIGECLKAVVNQRLLVHKSGEGLVPVVELLRVNFAVASLLRENKLHQLVQVLTTGLSEGQYSFERSAARAYLAGRVTREEAERIVPDRNAFRQLLDTLRQQQPKKVPVARGA